MNALSEEPVFQQVAPPTVPDDAGVAGEPALADIAAAADARASRRIWLACQWAEAGAGARFRVFAGLCAVSGLFAVFCALAKSWIGGSALPVIVGAPLVEEFAKAVGPLMVLEKKPWLFGTASSIVLVGVVAGFVFASIENLLYFFLYIKPDELTSEIVLWRLIVCTALHVVCATVSCAGLARDWKRAFRAKGTFSLESAVPYFITAMVIHGVYNFGVVLHASLWGE